MIDAYVGLYRAQPGVDVLRVIKPSRRAVAQHSVHRHGHVSEFRRGHSERVGDRRGSKPEPSKPTPSTGRRPCWTTWLDTSRPTDTSRSTAGSTVKPSTRSTSPPAETDRPSAVRPDGGRGRARPDRPRTTGRWRLDRRVRHRIPGRRSRMARVHHRQHPQTPRRRRTLTCSRQTPPDDRCQGGPTVRSHLLHAVSHHPSPGQTSPASNRGYSTFFRPPSGDEHEPSGGRS